MENSVILQSPALLALYAAALLLVVVHRRLALKNGILPVLSAFLAVGTTAAALLGGASLTEGATALLVFLAVHLEGGWKQV